MEGDTVVFAYRETPSRKLELKKGVVVKIMKKMLNVESDGQLIRTNCDKVCDISFFMPVDDSKTPEWIAEESDFVR